MSQMIVSEIPFITVSPQMIYDEICKTIIGQDTAKRLISTMLYTHYVLLVLGHYTDDDMSHLKQIPLLVGPSGNGKTCLIKAGIKALQKLSQSNICPLLEIDCTALTPEGYVGNSITKLLLDHYKRYGNNPLILKSTIVYFDEFDKICTPSITSGGSDFNKETQYCLLKALEGSDLILNQHDFEGHKTHQLSTASFGFILSGNFPEIRFNRSKKNTMGFAESETKAPNKSLKRQMQDIGMATQIAGRITSVVEISKLTRPELEQILRKNLIPQTVEFFSLLAYTLHFDESVINDMVDKAITAELGARGLKSEVDEFIQDKLFETSFHGPVLNTNSMEVL